MPEGDYYTQMMGLLASTEILVKLPKDLEEVLFRRGIVKSQVDDRRRFVRRYFPVKAVLELSRTLPAIERPHALHAAITRDLSRTGISFFYHAQLYPGERPVLWLTTGKIRCEVVRCLRHNEGCFEIGATLVKEDDGVANLRTIPQSITAPPVAMSESASAKPAR